MGRQNIPIPVRGSTLTSALNSNFEEIYDDILQIRLFTSTTNRDSWYTANPTELVTGAFAIVVVSDELQFQRYSGTAWVIESITSLTAAQIKTLYESNADTNALTDAFNTILGTITLSADQITFDRSVVAPNIMSDPGSLFLGSLKIDSAIHNIGVVNEADNLRGQAVFQRYDDTGGERAVDMTLGAVANLSKQPLGDTLQPNDQESFEITFTVNEFVRGVRLNVAELGTHNFVVTRNNRELITGELEFTSLGEADFRFSNDTVNFAGESATVTISGAKVMGTMIAGEFVPQLSTISQSFVRNNLARTNELRSDEEIQDLIGASIQGGSRITATYNDADGTVTLVADAYPVPRTNEEIQDIIGASIVQGANITVNYDDDAGTVTISSTGGGVFDTPRLTDFSIDIASRVDLNTDLNVSHTVTYDLMHFNNLTSLQLVVNAGDDKTITVPTADGAQSVDIVLSGIDTSAETSVVFQLSGVDTQGTTITSNSQTVTVRTLATHEFIYHGLSATNNPATVDTTTLTSVEAVTGDTVVSTGTVTQGQFYIILVPVDHDITAIVDDIFNQNVTDLFTSTTNVRQINSINFNSYVIGPLNADAEGENYTLTLN